MCRMVARTDRYISGQIERHDQNAFAHLALSVHVGYIPNQEITFFDLQVVPLVTQAQKMRTTTYQLV
ncbi:hypothetical protein D3C77_650080 [compost metagenome]